MIRICLHLLAICFLSGCAKLPVKENLQELAECKNLGVIEGKGETDKSARVSLVKASEKLGGNTVYLPVSSVIEVTLYHGPGSGPGRKAWQEINLVGSAYLCP